jgi:N-methylhydantoinase A
VSDANLVLHRLAPGARLADEITLDERRAATAIDALATGMTGIDRLRLAEGIVRIAVVRMVSAIKEISIARGFDPRDFALLAYGGAGPMHAALIAAELEIPRVVIPPGPGNFSALGSLISDLRHDHVQTRLLDAARAPLPDVLATFDAMEREGRARMRDDGIAPDDITTQRALGMRYVGQSWELAVRLPDRVGSMDAVQALFRAAHDRRYGWSHDGATEIVSFRVTTIGRVPKPALPAVSVGGTVDAARTETRDVCFEGAFGPVPVYDRARLPVGAPFTGPALVEEMGSVTVVPPGWQAAAGRLGELTLTRSSV